MRGSAESDLLYEKLKDWIHRHYREALTSPDLRDPQLVDETQAALDALTGILDLGPVYSFQRG